MADRIVGIDELVDLPAAMREQMTSIVARRCEDDLWSEESQRCFRGVGQGHDEGRCNQMLSLAQKDAVVRALEAVSGPAPARPDDSVATSPCPTSGSIAMKTWKLGTAGPDLCSVSSHALGLISTTAMAAGSYELRVLLTSIETTEASLSCHVSISVRSRSKVLGWASGRASGRALTGAPDDRAASDCVAAIVEDILTTRVGPLMQRHVAKLTSAGNRSPTAPFWWAPDP